MAAGGVVSLSEDDIRVSALRELHEEMGIFGVDI